jgi:hypothetical protein
MWSVLLEGLLECPMRVVYMYETNLQVVLHLKYGFILYLFLKKFEFEHSLS